MGVPPLSRIRFSSPAHPAFLAFRFYLQQGRCHAAVDPHSEVAASGLARKGALGKEIQEGGCAAAFGGEPIPLLANGGNGTHHPNWGGFFSREGV